MIRQRLCEAMYTVGRVNDAAETVLETVNTYGEEVYKSKAITKWVCGESFSTCRIQWTRNVCRFHGTMSLCF